MSFFYRILLSLAAPVLLGALFVRVLKRQERLSDLAERLGGRKRAVPGPSLWIHGASNGELTAARHLINQFLENCSDAHLVLTCNTVTARDMAQAWALPRTSVQLAPLDFRWSLNRFIAHNHIRVFALLEADFWPGRHAVLARRGIPAVLVSARISAKSAGTWARLPALAAALFGSIARAWPQDSASLARLVDLGLKPDVSGPIAELKSKYTAADELRQSGITPALTWLAASTHDGEDATILDAHIQARNAVPDLKLILAPRHPKRGAEIAKMALTKGLTVSRRSQGDAPETDVFIADTLGEMPLWYASARTCFVAGSLVPKGGHTPFEPHAHGCALIHGPHTENFNQIYQTLDAQGAAIKVTSRDTLAASVVSLTQPQFHTELHTKAQHVIGAYSDADDATDDIVKTLKSLLFP